MQFILRLKLWIIPLLINAPSQLDYQLQHSVALAQPCGFQVGAGSCLVKVASVAGCVLWLSLWDPAGCPAPNGLIGWVVVFVQCGWRYAYVMVTFF